MAEAGTKDSTAFLTQKVGPLPLWMWLAAGGALWWYFKSKQTATAAAANQQTDPAGNVGSIDPATGYVYGTPEDQAAIAASNAGSGGGSAGTNATTGAQTYADNNTWGIAAVNYLVGLGIDAVTANQAVQSYLSSQPLTTAQQGDVNLAIGALGAPPSLPGPVSTNPTPVTGTGTTTTTSTSVPAQSVTINVPDGSGKYMAATFPSQAAVTSFFQSLGVQPTGNLTGYWPGGLTGAQITAAVQKQGGTITSAAGQTGFSY